MIGIADDALPRLKLWVDMVAPLAALIISIFSAFIAVAAARAQARQARKTVQPHMTISLSDYENLLAVELVNSGAGCFIIDYLRVVRVDKLPPALLDRIRPPTFGHALRGDWDGSPLKPAELAPLHERVNASILKVAQSGSLVDVVNKCGVEVWSDFVIDLEGRATRPGDAVALLKLMQPNPDADFQAARMKVREALRDHVVFVVGHNIFGEPMPVVCRRLDWFGRDLAHSPRAMAPENAGAAATAGM